MLYEIHVLCIAYILHINFKIEEKEGMAVKKSYQTRVVVMEN